LADSNVVRGHAATAHGHGEKQLEVGFRNGVPVVVAGQNGGIYRAGTVCPVTGGIARPNCIDSTARAVGSSDTQPQFLAQKPAALIDRWK
jgi:hypothetical protein